MKTFVTVDEAADLLGKRVPTPEVVEVPLASALGCVLAVDSVSDIDMPPWNKSAMDGYAVVAEDLAKLPAELPVIEEIPAGAAPTKRVFRGSCSKIMTGAPVPGGADTVVQVEWTEPAGASRVRILKAPKPGANVCERGEDMRAGRLALPAGTRLRAQELAILATVGAARVPIYRPPRCAMIATGDELVPVDARPEGGQIRNSNSYNVGAQVRQMGLACDDLGIAADTVEGLRAKIREGLERDALLLSGGVSAGDYDLVIGALNAEGVEGVLHQVKIKPGRPFYFGTKGRKVVFALPGNPVSTFVIFEVYVRPFLGRMMGWTSAARRIDRARLKAPVSKKSSRVEFLPARLKGGEVEVVPWHGSADIFAMSAADAMAILPIGADRVEAGAEIDVMILDPRND